MESPAVVVGVDGSDSSNAAARWAALAARHRNLPLRVVHAVMPLAAPAFPDTTVLASIDWEGWAAEHLDTAVGPLRQRHPDVETDTAVQIGRSGALALSEEAQPAELLVVGSRGRGGFTSLLLAPPPSRCSRRSQRRW